MKRLRFKRYICLFLVCLLTVGLCACKQIPKFTDALVATATPQATAASTPNPTATPLPYATPQPCNFEVHFIDVGQGDCSLIICDGEAMLIDGGNKSAEKTITGYLQAYHVSSIKYIVATHPDKDHIGGLPGVITYLCGNHLLADGFKLFCSADESDTRQFENFQQVLDDNDLELTIPQKNQVYLLGNATIRFLNTGTDFSGDNNNSIVIKATYQQTSFLFAADIETSAEKALIEQLSESDMLSSTVLKVAHHGSSTSTSTEFLQAVNPSFAILSVGENNGYGHPGADVLERLASQSVKILRTDQQGSIILRCNEACVTAVLTEK